MAICKVFMRQSLIEMLQAGELLESFRKDLSESVDLFSDIPQVIFISSDGGDYLTCYIEVRVPKGIRKKLISNLFDNIRKSSGKFISGRNVLTEVIKCDYFCLYI